MLLCLGKVRTVLGGVHNYECTPGFRWLKGTQLVTLRGIQGKENPFKWSKDVTLDTHKRLLLLSLEFVQFRIPKYNGQWTFKHAENMVGKCMVCYRGVCQQWNSELVWQQWEQGILERAHSFFLGVGGHQRSGCSGRWGVAPIQAPDSPWLSWWAPPGASSPSARGPEGAAGARPGAFTPAWSSSGAVPLCSSATAVSLPRHGHCCSAPFGEQLALTIPWHVQECGLEPNAAIWSSASAEWQWRHMNSSEFKWPRPALRAGPGLHPLPRLCELQMELLLLSQVSKSFAYCSGIIPVLFRSPS